MKSLIYLFLLMSEQQIGSKFLDTVIDCVREVGPKSPKKGIQLENLYGEADELVKNLDVNINRCMRYNEAKINRKYEMIINDLQNQLKKVHGKLKIEQDARSPTKRHVTDLLDQLVRFKDENDQLKKQLEQYKEITQQLLVKNQTQSLAIKKLQNTQPKALIQRLPALSTNTSVSDSIKQYLKDKEKQRAIVDRTDKTPFQKFLHTHVPKSWNWNIGNLLEEIDKWSEGIKPHKQIDMYKIRSSVAKTFSEYLDDSTTLTKPASFVPHKSIRNLSPIHSEPKTFVRKDSRFSVFGDRHEKSFM